VSASTVRRAPILLVVAGLLAAAVALDRSASSPEKASAVTGASTTAGAVSVPAADALSTSWYCPEGTSNTGGRADETVIVGNLSDERVDATITVMPGGGQSPVSQRVQVEARGVARVHVAQIAAVAEPGVVVEVVGGQAVVEHQIAANGDIAIGPCARDASTDWYLAAGTTVKGAQQFLVLFDPFGDDAIVDVTLLTDTGVQQPEAVQALVIPRRSRVSVPIADLVPRQTLVAIQVHTRTGRVIAERSQLFDGTVSEGVPTRKGVALSLGATAPATEWKLPFGKAESGAQLTVAIANFGATPTAVEVGIQLEGGGAVAPQNVTLPARSVVSVDVGGRVAAGSRYAFDVSVRGGESARGGPVVVEALGWWSSPAGAGVASVMGATRPARRWVAVAPDVASGLTLEITNPGAKPVTASLPPFFPSDERNPTSERELAVAPARFVSAAVSSTTSLTVVQADHPVVAGLTATGRGGGAMTLAIPDYSAS
jgi:hypothetical protein